MPAVPDLTHFSRPQTAEDNPFEIFFRDPVYLEFKNHLYNYLRRREEINRLVKGVPGLVLEIGSGVSPVADNPQGNVIYSDLSVEAMKFMRKMRGTDKVLAMSATEIALGPETVSAVVCSEVLEHIKEDGKALSEMARVLKPEGVLILTVPAHPYYYSYDDRFVGHERRYEVAPLVARLKTLGFEEIEISKVTGVFEKVTMVAVVLAFRILRLIRKPNQATRTVHPVLSLLLPIYKLLNRLYAWIVKWEARIMPLPLASIVLIGCRKSR